MVATSARGVARAADAVGGAGAGRSGAGAPMMSPF